MPTLLHEEKKFLGCYAGTTRLSFILFTKRPPFPILSPDESLDEAAVKKLYHEEFIPHLHRQIKHYTTLAIKEADPILHHFFCSYPIGSFENQELNAFFGDDNEELEEYFQANKDTIETYMHKFNFVECLSGIIISISNNVHPEVLSLLSHLEKNYFKVTHAD